MKETAEPTNVSQFVNLRLNFVSTNASSIKVYRVFKNPFNNDSEGGFSYQNNKNTIFL